MKHGNQVSVQPAQSSGSACQDVHAGFPCHHPGRPGERRRLSTHAHAVKPRASQPTRAGFILLHVTERAAFMCSSVSEC